MKKLLSLLFLSLCLLFVNVFANIVDNTGSQQMNRINVGDKSASTIDLQNNVGVSDQFIMEIDMGPPQINTNDNSKLKNAKEVVAEEVVTVINLQQKEKQKERKQTEERKNDVKERVLYENRKFCFQLSAGSS